MVLYTFPKLLILRPLPKLLMKQHLKKEEQQQKQQKHLIQVMVQEDFLPAEVQSTLILFLKKVAAARIIMALFIAHPIIIENKVSANSNFSCFLMIFSSLQIPLTALNYFRMKKKIMRHYNSTRTLISRSIEPSGIDGFTQEIPAANPININKKQFIKK